MELVYPDGCTAPRDREEFCLKAIDNLTLLHNFFGEWEGVGGVLEERWLGIPPEMQAKYPYKPQVKEVVFMQFFKEDYLPVLLMVSDELAIARTEIKAGAVTSDKYSPDFSNVAS